MGGRSDVDGEGRDRVPNRVQDKVQAREQDGVQDSVQDRVREIKGKSNIFCKIPLYFVCMSP